MTGNGETQAMTCTFDGCTNTRVSRWRCADHYRPAQKGCSVDGCARKHSGAGFCVMHYSRVRTTGNPRDSQPERSTPEVPRFCSFQGCQRTHVAKGWCKMHYTRWAAWGDPTAIGTPGSPGLRLAAHPMFKGDQASYAAIHYRLRTNRGAASGYVCSCGAPANQWAYNHAAAVELSGPQGLPYSGDLNDYNPLCYSCHVRLDRKASIG